MSEEIVLEVDQLKTTFNFNKSSSVAVDRVSFVLKTGETLGIVGESGSGKSVTSLSIIGLISKPSGVVEGSVKYKGKELVDLSEKEMRKLRGKEIAMIFQEPMTSLNPVFTIGNQLLEAIKIHLPLSKKESKEYAVKMLELVGISKANKILDQYPHQLSGGMRQRVMIAMAMSCNPSILIADEPTTALDVTIQAQILDLMKKLKVDHNTSILLITHDLGVVAEMCDRVLVMYAGKVVEEADVRTIFHNPHHPYTIGLLKSTPRIIGDMKRLYSIPGNVPSINEMPDGCSFAPRCEFVMDKCRIEEPELRLIGDGHKFRCWLEDKETGTSEEASL